MKSLTLTPKNAQEVLKGLHDFFQTGTFQVDVGNEHSLTTLLSPSQPLKMRTLAPDGTEREAIFASVEGIIMRSTPVGEWGHMLMLNILLPWQSQIQWEAGERLIVRVVKGGATQCIVFLRSSP